MTKLDARKSGSFKVGGEIEIQRLGFGAMRITGKGIWGPPEDKPEAIRTLKRLPALGIDFVDPCGDSHDVIRRIASADRVIAESMHAAIIAKTAGTPPKTWRQPIQSKARRVK